MSDARDDGLAFEIDGRDVRLTPVGARRWDVHLDGSLLGWLELQASGTSFAAYRADRSAIGRPSPWGGEVTARFGTCERAVRALIESRAGSSDA